MKKNIVHSRRNVLRLGAGASLAPFLNLRAQEAQGEKTLRIALLGLGDYATNQLAPAISAASNATIAGIITGSPEKVAPWQKRHEIPDANVYNYDNIDEISSNDSIDAIYVVTPTGRHASDTIRSLEAGKHVICEKPMAPTVEDCTRMIEAAEKAGKTLQIGYRLHWEPHHMRLMNAMETQAFGDWSTITASNAGRMKNFDKPKNQWRISKDMSIAGALYDLGVYAVQGTLYSARCHPVSVTATKSTERTEIFTEVPETYEWELTFADGRKAKGFSSYGKSLSNLIVETAKGPISIDRTYGYSGQSGKSPDGPMNFPQVHQQKLQVEGQAKAILTGEASRVPGEMGRRDVRVIRGIVQAADSGESFKFGKFLF